MTTHFNSINVDQLIRGDGVGTRSRVRLATTQNTNWTTSASLAFVDPTLTISALTAGASLGLIDSVEPVAGDRILIKDATAASAGTASDNGYNGIWEVTGGTTTTLELIRAADLEVGDSTDMVFVWISEGTINANNSYVCTTNTTIANNGSNDTTWVQYDVTSTLLASRGGTGVTTFGGTNTILYTTSADTLASITAGNNGVLVTDATGVPSISSTLPEALTIPAVANLSLNDVTTGAFDLNLVANSDGTPMTADRTLTFDVNDADRTIDLGGNLTLGGSFTTTPTNNITFTTTGDTNVTLPTTGTLANQEYVDSVAQGLDVKNSVRISSEPNANWTTSATITYTAPTLTISALSTGTTLGLIDGIEPVSGDRILIKDAQLASGGAAATNVYNGLWEVTGGTTTSLTLTRTIDADEDSEVTAGLFTFVEEGTCADCGFVLTTDNPIVVNTTGLDFAQFSGAGQIIAGDGLTKTGNTLAADLKANGGLVIETGEIAVDLSATNITGTLAVGDGGTGATTITSNGVLYGNGTSAVQATASLANATLITDAGGVPSLSQTLPTAVQTNITNLGTVTAGTWNADTIAVLYGGTGLTSVSTNALVYGQGTAALAEVTPAANSVLVSDGANVPGWNTTLPSGLTVPSPIITGSIFDVNNNELIDLNATAAAVNHFAITNAATGTNPTFTAVGDDANVGINFQTKGTGVYNFLSTAAQSSELRLYEDTDNGTNYVAFTTDASLTADTTYSWPIAPAVNGYVLTSSTTGDLTWADPASIGAKRDYVIVSNLITTTNTTFTTVGYFPWDDSELSGFTTRTVILYHITGTRVLEVDVFDGTTSLGSVTTTASTSGITTFTFTAPGADSILEFRVRQTTNGNPRPQVYGIVMVIA